MDHWGTQFAREIRHRGEGQSEYALDLIDLLQQKAEEFNKETTKGFNFNVTVTPKGEDVEVTNGYKTVAVSSSALPGAIFVHVTKVSGSIPFEATLTNTLDGGFQPDSLPSECADPAGLAEWIIHEVFEP